MTPLQAVVLGLLQGIFEWLPVSSEAVLTLTMTQIFGTDVVTSLNSAIWLHTGTMAAALLYFRSDIMEMTGKSMENIREPGKILEDSLTRFIILSTVFTGVIGGSIYLVGKESFAGNPELFSGVTAAALILTGISRHLDSSGDREEKDTGDLDSVFSGILQGFSIIPGISRSGSTVFALLIRGFNGESAFRLSFLMSIPAVIAANIGLNLFSGFTVTPGLLIASLTAFVSGYATIGTVLKLADRTAVSLICFVLAGISLIPLVL